MNLAIPAKTSFSPEVGQVYAFRTSPFSEFAWPETGRFGAFKVLGVYDRFIVVAALAGIWPSRPMLEDTKRASILEEHRFAHTGRPAVLGVTRDLWEPETDLTDVHLLGELRLTANEQANAKAVSAFAIGTSFGTLSSINYAVEGEWRWANDRDKLVEEAALKTASDNAKRAARERYRTRLSQLTWEQLLSETPFERWSPSPPYPPEDFTLAARKVVLDACVALRDLGAKPRRAEVRAVLKETVQWFNEADDRAGGVIETEEREDICALLEEMAHVARQKALVDEIDAWREW